MVIHTWKISKRNHQYETGFQINAGCSADRESDPSRRAKASRLAWLDGGEGRTAHLQEAQLEFAGAGFSAVISTQLSLMSALSCPCLVV